MAKFLDINTGRLIKDHDKSCKSSVSSCEDEDEINHVVSLNDDREDYQRGATVKLYSEIHDMLHEKEIIFKLQKEFQIRSQKRLNI